MEATLPEIKVCDSIEYKGHQYRVQHFVKFLRKSANGRWWQFVAREEATHVVGYGPCGCIVPIHTAKVVGQVNWSPEEIAEEQVRAAKLHGENILA